MCKINVVLNRVMLGNRELGWEVWNGKNVEEYTSKQIEGIIRGGKEKVCGLKIGNNGLLEMDYEGYYTTNIMEHRHIDNYKPMNRESLVTMSYVCIGCKEIRGKRVYQCISCRFEQKDLEVEELRSYIRLGILSGGVKLDGEDIIMAEIKYPNVFEAKKEKDELTKDDTGNKEMIAVIQKETVNIDEKKTPTPKETKIIKKK